MRKHVYIHYNTHLYKVSELTKKKKKKKKGEVFVKHYNLSISYETGYRNI